MSRLPLISLPADPQGHGHELYPMTVESIAAAKAAQIAERLLVTQMTGIVIDDAGHHVLTPKAIAMQRLYGALLQAAAITQAVYGGSGPMPQKDQGR